MCNKNTFNKKYDKPFKTYEEQVQILKSRNLIINKDPLARHYLSEYSYYNLINGVGNNYLKHRHPDVFKDRISLKYLVKLQRFDQILRSILLTQLLNIESSLKTKLAHVVGYKFGVSAVGPGNYLRPSNYAPGAKRTLKILRRFALCNIQSKTFDYTTNRRLLSAYGTKCLIYHYKKHHHVRLSKPLVYYLEYHNHVPFWILVTNLTFGNCAYWYKNLKRHEKLLIMHQMLRFYNYKNINTSKLQSQFNDWITILNFYRNACAHGDVVSKVRMHIQDRNYSKVFNILFNTPYEYPILTSGDYNNWHNPGDLFSCILAILLLTDDFNQNLIFLKNLYKLFYINANLSIKLSVPKDMCSRLKELIDLMEQKSFKID